jgi:hypothetical protein
VTINGLTVPMSVISRFAPSVGLHYWEQYLPCSIEYILSHATLKQGQPSDYAGHLSDGTAVATNLTQLDLYNYARQDPSGDNFYLSIESQARQGGPPAGTAPPYDSSVLANVPMYVSVQVPTDKSFVDLNFYFLFAYNGPQTIRGLEPGRHFNAVIPNFAEHEGDIEGVTVRITSDLQNIVFVRYEAHGNSSYYAPLELLYLGTHPKVSCALFSHSTYNPAGKNANDWIELKDYALAEGVDIINDGPRWEPYLYNQLVLVGLDTNGQAINGQWWAAFAGRIGVHQLNTFQEAEGVGGDLDPDQWLYANSCGEGVQAYFEALFAKSNFSKYDADNVGVGPQGLGSRGSIVQNQPTYAVPEVTGTLFCRAGNNLVLSVNPTNVSGPVTVETFDPTLATQLWRRQEWDSSDGPRYVFINQSSGLILKADGVQGDAAFQSSTLTSANFWRLGGDEGDDFHAVQWAQDISQNLNLLGNGPYNPGMAVGTWSWGGGDPNEVWKFLPSNPAQTTGRIESRLSANGGNFYLSADPLNPIGQLVIEPFSSNSAAQIWIRQEHPATSGGTNYSYINQLTKLMLYASGANGGPALQTNAFSQNVIWYNGGDEGNGYAAFQFGPDIHQNLNVLGDNVNYAGAKVGTWEWGGGADNEVWRYIPTAPPPQTPVVIVSGLVYQGGILVLSPNPTNPAAEVVIEPYQPGLASQIWIRNDFPRVAGTSYVFVNQDSGLALYSPGGNGSHVTLVPFDANNNGLYWNYFGPGLSALQYAPDPNQNLNVFGDNSAYPGALVGTWEWGGGAGNEVWELLTDTVPPLLQLPATIETNTIPGQNYAVVNFNVSATDNFGVALITVQPPSGSQFPIGTNYVYCQAIDTSSNATPSESFKVIVHDQEPPAVYCPSNIVVPTDPGGTNAIVNFAALAFDNSGVSTLTFSQPTGSAFPIGSTLVQCVAVDPSGNRATNQFTVTVKSASPPVIAATLSPSLPIQLTISGVVGLRYQIQYKDDLASPTAWQTLASVTLSNASFSITDTNVVSRRYYRVALLP